MLVLALMRSFVGRKSELDQLKRHLAAVAEDLSGRMLSVRGRRQVGKSRLLSEFCRAADLPAFYFTASRQTTAEVELERFRDDLIREATLPNAENVEGVAFTNWEAALRQLHSLLPAESPSIVVFDEFPWLLATDSGLDGTLQKIWDRHMEQRPVLLIIVGSDLSMMERLTQHDQPLYGRARETVIKALSPFDSAKIVGYKDPGAALEAYLVTGGYPRLLMELGRSKDLQSFLREQYADENSDLAVVGQRVLTSEFPRELQAKKVLSCIGSGERTYKRISETAGIGAGPLARTLKTLREEKRLVAAEVPLSAKPSKETRYWIADPYLRFWLHFVEPAITYIARGRSDVPLKRLRETWPTYLGRAIEPIVRDAMGIIARDDERLGNATQVGGFWTRTNDPEVDLVGIAERGKQRVVTFLGSIKWHQKTSFTKEDWRALVKHQGQVPGAADAALVAVSRVKAKKSDLGISLCASDILAAFKNT